MKAVDESVEGQPHGCMNAHPVHVEEKGGIASPAPDTGGTAAPPPSGGEEKVVRAERKAQVRAEAAAGSASDEDKESRPSQADTLVKYACDAARFYRNPNSEEEPYALVKMSGHRECWLLKSTGFRDWLRFQFYSRSVRAPKPDSVNQALDTLIPKARYEGSPAPVFLRRAEHEGKIYIDLCDEAWRAIEIDALGWRIADEPHAHFICRRVMLPLPEPVRGAGIDELRLFLNGATERDFVLMVMWLLSAVSPSGPYPLLAVLGGPGTAKTAICVCTCRRRILVHCPRLQMARAA